MEEYELVFCLTGAYTLIIFLFIFLFNYNSKRYVYLCNGYIFRKGLNVETYEDGVRLKKALKEDPNYSLFVDNVKLPRETNFSKQFKKGFYST